MTDKKSNHVKGKTSYDANVDIGDYTWIEVDD